MRAAIVVVEHCSFPTSRPGPWVRLSIVPPACQAQARAKKVYNGSVRYHVPCAKPKAKVKLGKLKKTKSPAPARHSARSRPTATRPDGSNLGKNTPTGRKSLLFIFYLYSLWRQSGCFTGRPACARSHAFCLISFRFADPTMRPSWNVVCL